MRGGCRRWRQRWCLGMETVEYRMRLPRKMWGARRTRQSRVTWITLRNESNDAVRLWLTASYRPARSSWRSSQSDAKRGA